MVNNISDENLVSMMARDKSLDDVWDDIFDSLVIDNEPPFEYIKNVVITTKTGIRLKVNAADFAHILERERYLSSEESEILSCKLAINFGKVRRDVDTWADQLIAQLELPLDAPENVPNKRSPSKKSPAKKAEVSKTAAKDQPADDRTAATEPKRTTKKSTPRSKQSPKG